MNTKHNIAMLLIWIALSIGFYFLIEKEGAPEWAKDFFVFNAVGFFLIFINQAIADTKNDTNH